MPMHSKTVCAEHGTIYMQCRCPSLDKTVIKAPCDERCPEFTEEAHMKIEIRESADHQFYAVVVGDNGEDWYVSETYTEQYTAHQSAMRLVEAMRAGEVPVISNDAGGHHVTADP